MAIFLTISCKLQLDLAQHQKVENTLAAFSTVCTYINEQVDPAVRNKLKLQSLIYHDVRKHVPELPADLVVAAMGRVAENRKSAYERKCRVGQFRPTSASINTKAFRIREDNWTVSINLVGGREKMISLVLGEYQRSQFRGRKPVSAVLVRRADGGVYLQVQVEHPVPEVVPRKQVLGVALGMDTIVVMSTGEEIVREEVGSVRSRYRRVRSSLQKKASKGTRTTRRNCRRVLKRLSGQERRFATWVNHTVSRQVVTKAKDIGAAIALEDLTGMRERKNKRAKVQAERARINTWAFHQLRSFIEYKAAVCGVGVVVVPGDKKTEGTADSRKAVKIEFRGAAL
ncbi:IS200/IS605 family element transposase accessory protein TnpB [Nodosilinea sp. FACHB-131]|uniref:RNA-guided endonuclease TnpB family protein n=1 Tax=Cyanophyceae TaxID=3028117 RepID=UPI001683051F|nr:IS200/IS605 family element transposase accessory protein TnpB [Nodosilinea sp. FACHB-131]